MQSASAHTPFAGTRIVPKAEKKYQRGLQQMQAGDWRGAEKSFRAAIDHSPRDPMFWVNLAQSLRKQGRAEDAVEAARRSIALDPDLAVAHRMLGQCLKESGRTGDAAQVLHADVGNDADRAALLIDRGLALLTAGHAKEAVQPLMESIRLAPHETQAWIALSDTFKRLQMPQIAGECLATAAAQKPDDPHLLCASIHLALEACRWPTLAADAERLSALVRADKGGAVVPFMHLSVPGATAQDHLRSARRQWQRIAGHIAPLAPRPLAQRRPGRVRLAYFSNDMHLHATAYLLARVLELHDRERFEVFVYSYGPDDGSSMRRRLEAAVEHFVDLQTAGPRAIADRMRGDDIDILVDLKGYTLDARPEVLAYRAAPIQVSFLGYPGTLGTDCVDYLITDRIVSPPELADGFTEKFAWLPDCYQPNDDQRPLGAAPSRRECGLPDEGFVFACFNNTYKLTPEVFDVWCRLLIRVPGSVLWMLDANLQAKHNLWQEAEARGIARERLLFAPRVDYRSHLLRLQNADLFLDNTPVNAHTTASDALWACVPIVTLPGEIFASRVAASLLHAAGAPELVADSLPAYEALALRLATTPQELAALRQRLADGRALCALFDSARYTRALESLYDRMFERGMQGLAPDHIAAARSGPAIAAPVAATAAPTPAPASPPSSSQEPAPTPMSKPASTATAADAALTAVTIAYDACPLCGHQEADELGRWDSSVHPLWRPTLPPTMRWLVCCGCRHVFTDAYFSETGLRELFKGANENQLAGGQIEAQRNLWAPVVERVLRTLGTGCGDGRRWLDVGCGSGALVFTAAEFGFEAIGLDARAEVVERIKAFGYQAALGDASGLQLDAPVDVISMADVLEHLPYPAQALSAARNGLRPDGLLMISCPNTDSAAWRAMDAAEQNPYWHEIEHHHNFSRERLYALLRECGFEPVAYAISPRYRAGMEVLARRREDG